MTGMVQSPQFKSTTIHLHRGLHGVQLEFIDLKDSYSLAIQQNEISRSHYLSLNLESATFYCVTSILDNSLISEV